MMFGNRRGRGRHQERKRLEAKRRRLTRLMSRRSQLEALEDRRLLAVFGGGGAITINDNTTATPYPSTLAINDANVNADIVDVNVTLNSVSHTFPDDIDALLVGPAGGAQNALIMSDAGGGPDIVAVNLTFDDEAGSTLPGGAQIVSGTFQPSDFGTLLENLPAAAPATAGNALSVFDGADFEGNWNLFVDDDQGPDSGSIGSWSLDIQLGGAVTIDAGADADDAADDTFIVETVGANTRVTVNAVEVFNEPSAGITSLTIQGSTDNDIVSVLGTAGNYTTTVNTASGFDSLTVGRLATAAANSGSLANIDGDIVYTDAGIASVRIDNGADNADRNWMITSAGAGLANVTHNGITGSIQYDYGDIDDDVEIRGGGGDDQFTFDFTGGSPTNPLGSSDINIFGGGQNAGGDSIVLTGGPAFTTVTHTFNNENDGNIDVDGSDINYTGLEPITDNLNVANRVFTFNNAVPNAELTTSPGGLAATHTRIDSNQSELVDFTTPSASLVINLFNAGANTLNVTSLAQNYGNNPGPITNTINLGDNGDTVNFEATEGSATPGPAEPWSVVGGAGNDTVNITPIGKNLSALGDRITFLGNGGANDTLNIEDDNEAGNQTWTITSTTVTRTGWTGATGGATYDGTLEILNINDTGGGNDTIDVDSTSANATTNIFSAAGDDVFNIDASNLGGTNNFSGGDNDDQFNVNITAAGGITAPLNLSGNANDFGGGVGSRDVVNINENAALGVVPLVITYTGNVGDSEVTVDGLTSTLTIDTVETIDYDGAGGNNDTATVTGTTGNDLISVAPITTNRGIIFNNNTTDANGPFNGPPETFLSRLPGVSGGSARPDLDLSGLANANGLTIDDAGGAGDRLYVYGQSEVALNDGNTFDPFGFGNGNLLPAVAAPTSYDVITANDTATMVDNLLVVNYDNTDFAQASPLVDPAVVINAGEETTNPVGVADDITLTLSPNYKFQVNGNDPDPATTGIVPPNGDRLTVGGVFPVINVFSNKNPVGPPTVTIEFPGSGLLPFAYSSIEDLGTFNAATVNLIGDNNDPTVDQNDNFVVVGMDTDGNPADGAVGEFALEINGSLPLEFNGVQFLNVFGDDQNPPPGTPSAGPNDIDTLEITPWADDTPRGWGIDVSFNEGNPAGADGDQADLIILHTSLLGGQVSEDISIIPSGPDNGEIVVTNAGFGTPIVDIDYVANTDIIVLDDDGFLNDTDSLTLFGTDPTTPQVSGRNFITADFAAAGDLANPIISVSDGLNLLYRVRTVVGIETLTFETLGGDDNLTVLGQNNGANVVNEQVIFNAGSGDDTLILDNSNGLLDQASGINYDGGLGRDQVVLTGQTAVTSAEYFVGPENGEGQIVHQLGLSAQTVTFTGLEPAFDFVAAATATVHGTNAANAINYSASEFNPAWGKVSVDGFEPYHFSNKTDLVIQAHAGSDEINLNYQNLAQAAPDGLTGTITVNGGDPTDPDKLIINSAGNGVSDGLVVTPTAQGVGTVDSILPGVPLVNYNAIEELELVGQLADDDSFGVDGTAGDDILRYFSGDTPDTGRVTGTMNAAAPFTAPEINFSGMGQSITRRFNNFGNQGGSDTLIFHGTEAIDNVVLTPGGLINVAGAVPFANIDTGTPASFNGPGTTSTIVIRTFGGHDNVTVAPEQGVAVTVEGGQPDDGSDVLTFVGSGVGAVTLDLTTKTITEAGLGPVAFTGFETVSIDANNTLTVAGTANDDTFNVTPINADNDGSFDHDRTAGVVFEYTDTTTVTFAGNGGNDTLNVLGDDFVDVVTSTASSVTVDGSTVTFDGTIEGLNLLTFAGDDNVTLTGLTLDATVDAGDGNDFVDASAVTDDNVQLTLLGGAGNDNLIGGDSPTGSALGDLLDGGDGDDRLEGGRGQDFFFGGAGSDQLVWVAGDGSDLMEGGDGEDEMLFDALAGNNRLELFGGGRFGATANPAPQVFGAGTLENAARAIFALNSAGQDAAAVFLNMGDIEHINIDAGGGADQIIVNNQVDLSSANGDAIQLGTDLAATAVRGVEIDLGAADGAEDNVEFHGQQIGDDVNISDLGGDIDVAGFNYSIRVSESEVANDELFGHGQGGDDVIKAEPGVEATIAIILNGNIGDDFLSADAIINGGAGNDTLIGGAGDDTINGNDGDDIIDGRGGVNTIDGGNGNDTVLVSGTAADETLGVTHTAGTVTVTGGLSAGTQNIVNMERVAVEAGEGSDTIDITTLAGGILDYEILGGNPIGAIGDTLNLVSPTGVVFMAGPEPDSGGFVDGDGAIISFDEIEDVSVAIVPPGAIVIMGTGADDDITAVGVANDSVVVTVNDGPSILYAGIASLTLQGKDGDDDITIDVNNAFDVEFIVDGGLPTAGSDDLRITGDDTINDNPVWTPDAVDGGQLALDSLDDPIQVSFIEHLYYDGENDQENLTVAAVGAAAQYYFAHHPGPQIDQGFMGLRNAAAQWLGINYENLGTDGDVTADGSGAEAASLSALATLDDDEIAITFTGADQIDIDLISGYGNHVDLLSVDVQQYELQALGGNDTITLNGSVLATALEVLGGGPGGSDTMIFNDIAAAADTYVVNPEIATDGVVVVNAVNVGYVGIEHLIFNASGDAGDALTINDPGGDNDWSINAGPLGTDRVQIDSRESMDYSNFDTVTLNNGDGTDRFTIEPTHLTNFNTSLTVNGNAADADDVLTLVGTEAADVITSGATTVTVNGVTTTVGNTSFAQLNIHSLGGDDNVDLDLALAGVHKVVELGAGDDNLDASGMQDGDFFGGIGDDVIVGSPLADNIFGGAGNDTLSGLAGNDNIYGQEGNDTITGGTGNDNKFGGAGSDTFIWNNGDNDDVVEGDEGVDVQIVNGAGAGDDFNLSATQSGRVLFERTNLIPFTISMGDVEQVDVNGLGGGDTMAVGDLTQTDAEVINLDFGAAGDADSATVEGRTTDDALQLTSTGGTIAVQGLVYDVNLLNSALADGDALTVNGNEGDDAIGVDDGVETLAIITLNGGDGDDLLTGTFNTANGDAGDDTIIGGDNDQTFNGGDGEDTFVGGDGNDSFSGGDDFDTILIEGTLGNDVIDVFQANPSTLNHTVNGNAQVDILDPTTIEQARIVAGEGADLIRVNWLDAHGVNANLDALRMTVEGGDDATSDRLVVVDDGTDDLVLYRQGQEADQGTVEVGPGNAEPLLTVFDEIERVDFIDENGVPIDNLGGPQLVVFKHDPFEANDDRFNATYLGSDHTINVDPTIDPGPVANPFGDGQNLPGDTDYYRVVAETTGTLDFQVYFRHVETLASGRPGLPNDGNLDINVRDVNGNIIAGFGVNDANDDERVRIPAVEGQTYYLEVIGAEDAINVYNITVVNHAPPTPYAMELLDNPPDGTTNPPGGSVNSDTGRSQFDNHTYDNTPTLYFRLDDGIFLHDLPGNPADDSPPDEVIPIPFRAGLAQPNQPGFAIAIFDEGNTLPQTATAPQTPLGFASATAQEGVYTFTVPAALSDGSHFLTARVQMLDPANPLQTGFGPRSDPFEIVVDTVPPPVAFGSPAIAGDGLHPDSDSGDPFVPATQVDRITNDLTPTFFGRAEANSIIRAYVDANDNGVLDGADVLIGQTVAIPLDGTNQAPNGEWEITSTVNMNDPNLLGGLGIDGVRRIFVTAEDLAGNITSDDEIAELEIFIDTRGPQVTDVFITDFPAFDIFTLKPDNVVQGPTPRVDSLTIDIQDLPERAAGFLYEALSNVPPVGLIWLVGDHTGIIELADVDFTSDPLIAGNIATGFITLTFDEPLPDDRYTLTLSEDIIDPAGNQLDGESNAAEPNGGPFFPSGDGIPGNDFVARFTVDSRPEVATWAQGSVYADINGNFVWDPEGEDNDATNRDFAYKFGQLTDAYFVGDFNVAGGGDSSGFDKLGVYGKVAGTYQFFLDTDDDGVGDTVGNMFYQVVALPVAGNFAGGHDGDEIGAYDGQFWYLDTNGDNHISAGERLATSMQGLPLVGDFNGDGNDDLAVYNNDTGEFQFDTDRDGDADEFGTYGFSGFGERPVAGDFNLDGVDDIGLYVPHQEGVLPKQAGEFHFLISDLDGGAINDVFGNFDFSPAPLGNDLISQFGDDVALPLFGNFDPPVATDSPSGGFLGSLTNDDNPLDTNLDGDVTALDALVVINALGRGDLNNGASPLRVVAALNGYRLDASGDGNITSLDALRVINGLRDLPGGEAEAVAPGAPVAWADAADRAISDLDDDDDELLLILSQDQAVLGGSL